MEVLRLVDVLSRWTHVGTAIVILGGSVFLRYVLMPSARVLEANQHDQLRDQLMSRWKKFVMIGIALFLVSGFYNYFRAMPVHKGDKLYHPLIGTKILLSLGVFFLASVLVGRSPKFEKMREQRGKWLAVTILLSALVVGMGGAAKVLCPPKAPPAVEQTSD